MADLDLAEMRRLAEALSRVGPDDELPIYWRRLVVKAGDEITRLLDRLEAAEARVEDLEEDVGDWQATYDGLRAEHEVVSGLARDMAGAIGYETPGDSWVEKALALRPLLAELAATRDARAAAVPGAVAGEPESTPAADLPEEQRHHLLCDVPNAGSCFQPTCRCECHHARHPRAADTQEAHDAG